MKDRTLESDPVALVSEKMNWTYKDLQIDFFPHVQTVEKIAELKSHYEYVFTEVHHRQLTAQKELILASDSIVFITTIEPAAMQSLEDIFLKHFHNFQKPIYIVFNQIRDLIEVDIIKKKFADLFGKYKEIHPIFVPEDRTLQEDIMRQNLFGEDYLTRISGQAWRQALDKILHQFKYQQQGSDCL